MKTPSRRRTGNLLAKQTTVVRGSGGGQIHMFDPADAFAPPVCPRQSPSFPLTPPKRTKLTDSPSSWVPKLNMSTHSRTSDGVPTSIPVFTLPHTFSQLVQPPDFHVPEFEQPRQLPFPPIRCDPRRSKFKQDPKFPLAGLLREDGGVFAVMDASKRAKVSLGEPHR